MATVGEKIARKIAANNGVYVGDDGGADPQCHAVFTYRNLYTPTEFCFAVAYTEADFARYEHLEIGEILWKRGT